MSKEDQNVSINIVKGELYKCTNRVIARERILTEPESPKNLAWDNPFGAFPPKKKDQKHKKHASFDGTKNSLSAPSISSSDSRPHTSQGHRKHELARPGTSHGHQPSPPPESPRLPQESDMPLRKRPPGPDRKQGPLTSPPGVISLPSRPNPVRSNTQPAPETRDPQFQQYGGVDPYSYDQQNANDQNYGQQPPKQSRPVPLDQRRPSEQSQVGPPRQQSYGQDSYRGVPIQKTISNPKHESVDMPNFDAISPSMNETTFESPPAQQEQPAYAKKAYQTLDQVNTKRRPAPLQERSESPLADFSFNLPQQSSRGMASPAQYDNPPLPNTGASYDDPPPSATASRFERPTPPVASASYSNPPLSPGPANTAYNQHGYDPRLQTQTQAQNLPPRTASRPQAPQSQFPPRGASRVSKDATFDRNGPAPVDSGYWQRSPEQADTRPHTAGANQARGAHQRRQSSRDDYLHGPEGFVPSQPTRRPTFDRDPYSDPGNAYQQQDQLQEQLFPSQSPPRGLPMPGDFGRVRSSDSAHPPPVRDHGDRPGLYNPRPDMPPAPGGFGDRPVPFRPGLAQANTGRSSPGPQRLQAPPQTQIQQAPPPQPAQVPQPRASAAGAPAVTINELNDLREGFKNNPNNGELGLRFAKRLVEAASVLSSEHGRADAKQTAKNRERYIFDATKVIKKLVSNNYPDAMFYFADCYGQGLLGLPVDPKEAFSLYQSAAKLNHAQSAYRVAVCCELGSEEGGGTRRDPLKALQWYRRAASLGDTPAMYKMGMIQLKGLLTQPRNPREAVSWLKRAAERADKDNPHALHELGLLYESAAPTDHILRDEKYSLQLFTQAAELGYKYSQFRLGSAYEYGLIGCAIDARQSIAWYTRAAAQGEHQSELALSGWYLTGAEPLLQQSDTEAYLWARKAALSGLAKAEYAMGYFTETGIGTERSGEEARRWYYRAAGKVISFSLSCACMMVVVVVDWVCVD